MNYIRILILFVFLVNNISTKLNNVLHERIYFILMDRNGNFINEPHNYNTNFIDNHAKVFSRGNSYSPETRRRKFKMSKLERGETKKYLYEKYQQEQKLKNVSTNLFEQVREWNKKHGFTVSKGTCDRRSYKVCKNACLRVKRRICNEIKCKSSFKEEVNKNCAKICKLEFKHEFNNIF